MAGDNTCVFYGASVSVVICIEIKFKFQETRHSQRNIGNKRVQFDGGTSLGHATLRWEGCKW